MILEGSDLRSCQHLVLLVFKILANLIVIKCSLMEVLIFVSLIDQGNNPFKYVYWLFEKQDVVAGDVAG